MDTELFPSKDRQQSDIVTWENADRNYSTLLWISIILGFFGADHFYLRNFNTILPKLAVNVFTLGLWWIWDVMQLLLERKKVLVNGMDFPLDWGSGIGRGVILASAEDQERFAEKDLIIFILLAVFGGILGLDRLYLDEVGQGVVKFLSMFLLVGIIWYLHDIIYVLFYRESIMSTGLPTPLPFSKATIPYSGWYPWEAPLDTAELFKIQHTEAKLKEIRSQKAGMASKISQVAKAAKGGPAGLAAFAAQKALEKAGGSAGIASMAAGLAGAAGATGPAGSMLSSLASTNPAATALASAAGTVQATGSIRDQAAKLLRQDGGSGHIKEPDDGGVGSWLLAGSILSMVGLGAVQILKGVMPNKKA